MKKTSIYIAIIGAIIIILAMVFFLIQGSSSEKLACSEMGGEYKGSECIIGDVAMPEEELSSIVSLINSCKEMGGKYIKGDNMSCKLNGEIYTNGSWEIIEERKAICESEEYSGEWIGGSEFKCEINGKVYNNNWERVFTLKNSCELSGGEWLGSESMDCKIGDYLYSNAQWELLPQMRDSCSEYRGEWIGGPEFKCRVNGIEYKKKAWVRASATPDMASMCEDLGGNWIAEYRECENVTVDDCIKIEQDLEEIKGLGFKECASPCRHTPGAENCAQVCVPVCYLNL